MSALFQNLKNYLSAYCLNRLLHVNVSVALLSTEGQKALGFHKKYLNLCSVDEQRSYGFGMTWGWVINDRIFIFGWTIPLRLEYAKFSIWTKTQGIIWWHCKWLQRKMHHGLNDWGETLPDFQVTQNTTHSSRNLGDTWQIKTMCSTICSKY